MIAALDVVLADPFTAEQRTKAVKHFEGLSSFSSVAHHVQSCCDGGTMLMRADFCGQVMIHFQQNQQKFQICCVTLYDSHAAAHCYYKAAAKNMGISECMCLVC